MEMFLVHFKRRGCLFVMSPAFFSVCNDTEKSMHKILRETDVYHDQLVFSMLFSRLLEHCAEGGL